jgi:hypothetical protein
MFVDANLIQLKYEKFYKSHIFCRTKICNLIFIKPKYDKTLLCKSVIIFN